MPSITLFVIVTSALCWKSMPGRISTPPPSAHVPSPKKSLAIALDRVTPPVIVTPSMETVGWVVDEL